MDDRRHLSRQNLHSSSGSRMRPQSRGGRPCSRASRASSGAGRRPCSRSSRASSADGLEDEAPFDGGFDEACCADDSAPYSNPRPQKIRHLDEPKGFDCLQPHAPVSMLAPKKKALGRRSPGSSLVNTCRSSVPSEMPQRCREAPQSEGPPQRRAPAGRGGSHEARGGSIPGRSDDASLHASFRPQQGAKVDIKYTAAGGEATKMMMMIQTPHLPNPPHMLGGRPAETASMVKDLDLLGSTSRRRFGGRA